MNDDPATDAPDVFEHDLTDLLATAFACGTSIEGVWEVSLPVADAPTWAVTIERRETDADPPYEPEFLED